MSNVGMAKTKSIGSGHLFVMAGAGHVMLNWVGAPELELDLVAGEYLEAAKALMSRYRQKGHNDLAAYPILCLYRHAMELFLKSLLILGHRFSGLPRGQDTEDALDEHALLPLLQHMDCLFTTLGKNGWFGLSRLDEEAIKELDRIDPTGEVFRYTVKTFRRGRGPTTEQDFRFSLNRVGEVLDPTLETLSNACLGLREYYRNLVEAR